MSQEKIYKLLPIGKENALSSKQIAEALMSRPHMIVKKLWKLQSWYSDVHWFKQPQVGRRHKLMWYKNPLTSSVPAEHKKEQVNRPCSSVDYLRGIKYINEEGCHYVTDQQQ